MYTHHRLLYLSKIISKVRSQLADWSCTRAITCNISIYTIHECSKKGRQICLVYIGVLYMIALLT